MKKWFTGIILAILLLSFAMPVMSAVYYAYLTVEEDDGNDYEELAVTCTRNITQLVMYDLITSTGLDTRVLTGDGYPLPHMLAEDRIMLTTDLDAYETKTLIFYCGATSLSNFYIIPGYGGSITTPDDEDLELGHVIELLVSGYFDTSAGSDKNILYKEDAFKMNISAANTLRVAALEAGDVEQWEMHYSPFTMGSHTVYVMANGLVAYLYVDDFEVAKDTANLFDSTSYQCVNKEIGGGPWCYYAQGYYWVFYYYDTTNFAYVTSPDGLSWSGESTIAVSGSDTISSLDIEFRDDYVHLAYADGTGTNYLRYRQGVLTSNPSITWSDDWQTAATDVDSGHSYNYVNIGVDNVQYPYITWQDYKGASYAYITKSANNDGTWSTAGGYPWELWSVGSNGGNVADIVGFPSSNKMYLIWEWRNYAGTSYITYAYYYNGSSWEPQDTIDTYVNMNAGALRMTADDNDNVWIGWCDTLGVGGNPADQYLSVRFDGEVWGGPVELHDDGGYIPYVCYNENTDVLYITWPSEPGAGYVYCATLDIDAMEINPAVPIMANLEYPRGINPYGDHIGFILNDTNAYHGLIDLTAYAWNDNLNDWTWMMNDVMPYADYMIMAVDGVTHLHYEPDTIIEDDTLPDISGASGNDGEINWGDNPVGVNASLYVLQPETEEEPIPPVTMPTETDPADFLGPTGQPGWTSGLPVLATNPLYPLVNVLATATGIPLGIVWILGASFLLLLAMILCMKYMPHQIITALVGGGLAAFFYAMGIYPFWVVFIFAAMAIAVIIGERKPTL